MEETNHKELFDNAKEAQNNIVEDKRIRYQDSLGVRMSNEEFDAWYYEEFNETETIPIVPYVPASHLMKGQRKLAERAITKLECLIKQEWLVKI
jgi:hypothetical protein